MQLKFLKPSLLALSCAILSMQATALADEASLQRQIDAQQRSMIAQQNQIAQLQQDIATLRGEMEQMRYLLSRQSAVSVSNSSSSSSQSSSSSVGGFDPYPSNGSGSGPVTAMGNDNRHAQAQDNASVAPPKQLQGVDPSAQLAYNSAYALVQKNDLKGAQTAFKSYVEKYPNNALTPNAWYWLGQVQYSQAIYDQARLSFLNVARYNDSQKRPDALYKLGMISKFLGDTNKAQRYFQLVIQTYPNDAAATLASRELQRLQS